MDRITIEGLEVFAHHGVLEHERELGQRFTIDAHLELDLTTAAASDDLDDTVDYGALARRLAEVAREQRFDLIEALAGRLAACCLEDGRVLSAEVTVHKPSAPLPVVAREVAVTVRRSRS